MTYGPDNSWPPDDEHPTDEFPAVSKGPDDEGPYPEGHNLLPVIASVLVVCTLICWWLAFYAPDLKRALIFGIGAPFVLWYGGMRIARGSKAQAEAEDRDRLLQNLEEPVTDIPPQIAKYMLGHEWMLFYGHRHPITILGRKRVWLGGLIALFWAALAVLMLRLNQPLVAAGIVVVALLVLGWQYWAWRNEWFWVTDYRVQRSFGIFKRRIQMIPRDKIDAVNCITPATSHILAKLRFIWSPYGHIFIETPEDEVEEKAKAEQDKSARIEELKYLPGAANVSMVVMEWKAE